jgi:hypothetical protein
VSVNGRRFAALAVILVAVNVFFWLAQSGFALSRAGGILQLIGGPVVRADIAWVGSSGVQETQIDRGVVVSFAPGSVTLREADGSRTIQLASAASVPRLRRGMRVIVAGPAGQPATTIQVEGFR